jgi:sorbitol-specific phosphotransferase system component IIC
MAEADVQRRLFEWFPAILVLLTVALILFGFSHTVGRELMDAGKLPPAVLVAHAVMSVAWLVLLSVQVSLVASGWVALHRRLGIIGAGLGGAMSVVALITAIELRKLDTVGDPIANLAYLAIPLGAWLSFTVPFVLGLAWRAKPERHRPLMLIAACLLAGPALGRIPEIRAIGLFMTGVIPDGFVIAAMVHDRLRAGRWSRVYLCALPLVLLLQGTAVYLQLAQPEFWISTVRWILSVVP